MRDRESVSMEPGLPELAAAFSRFGADPKARFRWLTEFVEQDLTTKEAADEASLGALVFAFAGRMGVGPRAPARIERLSAKTLDPRSVREARATVERAQRAVREALNGFATDGRCTLRFQIVGWERLPDGRVVPVVGGDWWSRFYGAVFMLVVELGPDLRVCDNPTCRKLFLRSKRQTYCSSRCSQRERTQRFRQKHPQRVSDLRHASHVRRQQKRLGPRVKVRRRRRHAVSKDSQ
jgi:hypothetical protein